MGASPLKIGSCGKHVFCILLGLEWNVDEWHIHLKEM